MTTRHHQRRRRRRRRGALAAVLGYAGAWLANRSLHRVTGTSMLPSLWPGDLVVTAPTRLVTPRPGDVVVVVSPAGRVVKRLAAVGGQRALLVDGHLHVDGAWWRDPAVVRVDEDLAWPPAPGVVVLGDHRASSTDSRHWGRLPPRAVRRVVLARARPVAWLRRRVPTHAGARRRPGVRLVVLDPDDRLLLFRVRDHDGTATWWEAPGGGRRPHETAREAARRELAEEVGAGAVELVPLALREDRPTTSRGAALRKVEDVFAARVGSPRVDRSGWTAAEHRDIVTSRWFALGDLPDDVVAPADLATAVRCALELLGTAGPKHPDAPGDD